MVSEHWHLGLGRISVAFFIISAALPKSISAGELGASLMGQRAERERCRGEGMEGRCLGSVGETAETGSILLGLECLRWLLSGLVSDLVSSC